MNSIKLKSPAKINLFLEAVGKRKDGYHNLITVFAKIDIFDFLTLKKTDRGGIKIIVKNNSNLRLKKTEDNIIYKTAVKFFDEFKIEPNVNISFEKNIPVGAGLGGGSANSAVVLKGLCLINGVDFKKNRGALAVMAQSLGADVPFFMSEESFCLGRGKGEKLSPFEIKTNRYSIIVAYPGLPISTKDVFSKLKLSDKNDIASSKRKCSRLVKGLKSGSEISEIKDLFFNKLEDIVLPGNKNVLRMKKHIISLGADVAMMSGSGSSVFGVFSDKKTARAALKQLSVRGNRVFLTKFL